MKSNRRNFIKGSLTALAAPALGASYGVVEGVAKASTSHVPLHGRKLKVIVNSDINHRLYSSPGKYTTPRWFKDDVLLALMFGQPGVYAQDVGLPEAVTYRSAVATTLDKHLVEVSLKTWPKEDPQRIRADAQRQVDALRRLFEARTDALALTVEACHERGIQAVASYRMNAEDWYQNTWMLSAFGRQHPDWRIPGTGALDPAVPGVYEHRMKMFSEVAEKYDIDGIEFNFKRWYHMISKPRKNYPILTRMVRETRNMLDRVAKRKGRGKLLLGARVGANLSEKPLRASELSCRDLGLDVKTWIQEGYVDYLCPSMFSGTVDRSNAGEKEFLKVPEFVELARNSACGIYPTVWHYTGKARPGEKANEEGEVLVGEDDPHAMRRYKNVLCRSSLDCYGQGADGVSTFNWFLPDSNGERFGMGVQQISVYASPKLGNPNALRRYEAQESALPEGYVLRAYLVEE